MKFFLDFLLGGTATILFLSAVFGAAIGACYLIEKVVTHPEIGIPIAIGVFMFVLGGLSFAKDQKAEREQKRRHQ